MTLLIMMKSYIAICQKVLSNPIEFFELFFRDDLMELIFDQPKLNNDLQNLNYCLRKMQNIEIEDITKVFQIVLHMGIVK